VFTFTPYHLPLIVSAAMLAALAVATWRQRASPVARVFFFVSLLAVAWTIIYSFDIATADLDTKVFLVALRAPVVACLPVTGVLIALFYAGLGGWLTPTRLALLLFPALLSFLAAATSQLHPYWRTNYRVEMSAVPVLLYEPAIGHRLNTLWGYSLVVVMLVLLLRTVRDAPGLYLRRAGVMFAGLAIALVPHALFDAGITPIRGYNIAPSLFGVSAALYFWGTLRGRVLELIPTARSVIVDQLPEAVFVLDARDRVVDANRAALEALDLPAARVIGHLGQDVLRRWGIDLLAYGSQPAIHEEIVRGEGAARRIFDVSITPLSRDDSARGRIVVLRDTTERELAREASHTAAALDAQREAEERVRREIAELLHTRIQNQLLSLVFQLGEIEHLWKDAPPEVVAHLRSIRDNLDRIRDREVRIASHRLYPALLDMGLAPALHMLGERFQSHFGIAYSVDPAFSTLDAPLDNKLPMVLRETIYRVVEEALSNAQRHAGASRVTISRALRGAGRVEVIVADNGAGADAVQLKPRLGLRTVEARVRNIGGTWRLTTAPGQGTTLAVDLPLSPQPAGAPAPVSALSGR
jgi:signal transduction histidine kinase